MRRGDLVTIAVQGDFGKPRPAVIVQNDMVSGTNNVLVCPLTTAQGPFETLRVAIPPAPGNGLRSESFAMITNVVAAPRSKCGTVIGRLTDDEMAAIDARLAFVFGLAR